MFSNLDSPTEKVVMLGIYNQEEAEDQDAEIEKEFEGVQSWVDKQEKDVENISKTHPFSKGREHIDLDNLKKLTLKMQKDALHIKADAEVSLGHKRTFNIYISESLHLFAPGAALQGLYISRSPEHYKNWSEME